MQEKNVWDGYRTSTAAQLDRLHVENERLRRVTHRLTRATRQRVVSRGLAFAVGAYCAVTIIGSVLMVRAGTIDFAPTPYVLLVDDIRRVPAELSYPWCDPGTRRRCDTEHLGTCADGEQVCSPDVGWSPCVGADPTAEICDGVDNDCDGRTDENRSCVCIPNEERACPVWDTGCGSYGEGRRLKVGYQLCDAGGHAWSRCSPYTEECPW